MSKDYRGLSLREAISLIPLAPFNSDKNYDRTLEILRGQGNTGLEDGFLDAINLLIELRDLEEQDHYTLNELISILENHLQTRAGQCLPDEK